MAKKRKIKIYSYNGKKLLSLTEEEINNVKVDERYEKIYESEFAKAKHRVEIKDYYSKAFWKDLIWIILGALLTTIGIDFFITTTGASGLFPGGFGAISRFLSILINSTFEIPASTTYFIFYFLINAPLAIFGYFKIGGKFALSTVLFLALSTAFDLAIQNTPYINSRELTLLMPINLLSKTSSMGTTVLWLFVFAIFAGLINGFAYSLSYKAGSSTGGSDWISYYYSIKYDKSIGMVNVKINIVTLITIIILNTTVMQRQYIDSAFKMNQIYYDFKNLSLEQLSQTDFWKSITEINKTVNEDSITSFQTLIDSEKATLVSSLDTNWLKVCHDIALNTDFDNAYTTKMMVWMKLKYILGPSLFSSFILIIVQGITVDRCYPKNKIMNLIISTYKLAEVQQYLYNVGYNNNVIVWQTRTSKKNLFNDQEQDLLMISMPLIYWKKIEDHLIKIDEDIIVNITSTKSVKGKNFSYKFDNETRDKAITEEFLSNAKLMKKIENESIIKTYKRIQKAIK